MPEPVRYRSMPPPNAYKKPIMDEEKKERKVHENKIVKQSCENEKSSGINKILSNLKADDIIIFAVILILLMDDCDDTILLIALGLVLFSDFFGL